MIVFASLALSVINVSINVLLISSVSTAQNPALARIALPVIKQQEIVIVLLDGLEMIAANANALIINMDQTAQKRVNVKLIAQNYVTRMTESVIVNPDGAVQRAIDLVLSLNTVNSVLSTAIAKTTHNVHRSMEHASAHQVLLVPNARIIVHLAPMVKIVHNDVSARTMLIATPRLVNASVNLVGLDSNVNGLVKCTLMAKDALRPVIALMEVVVIL